MDHHSNQLLVCGFLKYRHLRGAVKFAAPTPTFGLLRLSHWGFGSPQFFVPTSHLWTSFACFVGELASSLLCRGATIPCRMLFSLIWVLCPGARAPPSTGRDGAPLMYSSVLGRTQTQWGPARMFCLPGVPRGGLPIGFARPLGGWRGHLGAVVCGGVVSPPYAFL